MLTIEEIKSFGFKKVNNSTWRKDEFTLINHWYYPGKTIAEKILNMKKCHKLCYKGKYYCLVFNESDLNLALWCNENY